MKIQSLHRDYIQKSRLFLYPALGIKRGVSVTPVQTYLSWEGQYTTADNKFIIVYHLRDDSDFRLFEDVKLLGNPMFHEFFELEEEGLGAYVFDFSEKAEDFQKIVRGKYSTMSPEYKRTVLNFFKSHRSHHVYIESYLFPEKYFPIYAELLTHKRTDVADMYRLLTRVGELCSKPDKEEEYLKMGIKILDFDNFPLNLHFNQTNNKSV